VNASSVAPVRFVDTPGTRRRRRLKLWGLAIGVVIFTAALGISFLGIRPGDASMFFGILSVMFAAVGALVAGPLAAVSAYMRGKKHAASKVRPDAFVFGTQRTPELLAAPKMAGTEHPPLGVQFAVTVGPQGVELWGSRSADGPRVVLRWSDIDHVHPGQLVVSNGRRSFPALTMHVFRDVGGRQLDLPLPICGRSNLRFARPDRANEVLDAFARYSNVT
jgi:hypothetical protein